MLIITIKEHTLAVGAAGKHGQQNHYQSRGVGLCLLKVLFYSFFFLSFLITFGSFSILSLFYQYIYIKSGKKLIQYLVLI